jgi:hypothetical protein
MAAKNGCQWFETTDKGANFRPLGPRTRSFMLPRPLPDKPHLNHIAASLCIEWWLDIGARKTDSPLYLDMIKAARAFKREYGVKETQPDDK